MKKITWLFCVFGILITSISVHAENLDGTQHVYDLGKSGVHGVLDGLGERLSGAAGKDTQKFIDQLVRSLLSGGADSLKSPEFKKFTQEASKAISEGMVSGTKGIRDGAKEGSKILREAMNDGSKELSSGMNDSLVNMGKELEHSFRKGGEFDKGLNKAVDTSTGNINRGIQSLVHNNLIKGSAILLGATAGYFVVAYGIPLGFKMLERAWTRPKLIIASSKKGWFDFVFGAKNTPQDMIFTPHLEQRLNELVDVTKMIHKKIMQGKSNVVYRNLLLYGPPGTGKTLFATELAKRCGLEYVFMSGSSFSKFKDGEGIEALDELFAWANKSKGLLIFIDEAETFLLKRENMSPQSQAYLLLNNFLNYTGTRSNKFMIVFATNHKEVLDSAMYRRIDDLVQMPLPGKAERVRILNLYKNKILLDDQQNDADFLKSVIKVLTPSEIDSIAIATKGLSGSELEGIINNIKTSADILEPAVVTKKLVDKIVAEAIMKYTSFTGGIYLSHVEN